MISVFSRINAEGFISSSARPCGHGVYLLSEFFTISPEKDKIIKRPNELLQKCCRDPRDERDNIQFTILERKLVCLSMASPQKSYHDYLKEIDTLPGAPCLHLFRLEEKL